MSKYIKIIITLFLFILIFYIAHYKYQSYKIEKSATNVCVNITQISDTKDYFLECSYADVYGRTDVVVTIVARNRYCRANTSKQKEVSEKLFSHLARVYEGVGHPIDGKNFNLVSMVVDGLDQDENCFHSVRPDM